MPNVTSVWDFSPGETLTAAKLDDVNCGIHVFSGTATRDAAYGGSGERVLSEGEFAYLADSDTTQYYDGSSWKSVGATPGLQFVTGGTFTTVTSISLPNDTFTSTYRNYRIIFSLTATTGTATITGRVRVSGADKTGSNYWQASAGIDTAGNANNLTNGGSTSFALGAIAVPITYSLVIDAVDPQTSKLTHTFTGNLVLDDAQAPAGFKGRSINAIYSEASATQLDSFTLISSVASSISGVYRVYGYSES